MKTYQFMILASLLFSINGDVTDAGPIASLCYNVAAFALMVIGAIAFFVEIKDKYQDR